MIDPATSLRWQRHTDPGTCDVVFGDDGGGSLDHDGGAIARLCEVAALRRLRDEPNGHLSGPDKHRYTEIDLLYTPQQSRCCADILDTRSRPELRTTMKKRLHCSAGVPRLR